MMVRTAACVACLLLATGCASTGGGVEAPPVPVFLSADEVPCEYEVMRTVRRSTTRMPRSTDEYERTQAEMLGRAGADVGADAVIAPRPTQGVGRTVSRPVGGAGAGSGLGPPRSIEFEGQAVRFIAGTCS